MIRLVLDDPETEIDIEVGDVDVELETQAQPRRRGGHRRGGHRGGGGRGGDCCDNMDRCTHGRRGHRAEVEDDDGFGVYYDADSGQIVWRVDTGGSVEPATTRAPGRVQGVHVPTARHEAPRTRRYGQASDSTAAAIIGAIRILFDS
ncbi:MAG: hypothetical protein ACYTFO_05645 [Planctomycetota bacterium]